MPTQTFTWTPDYGLEKEVTNTVTEIKFGDGYNQRVRRGLNTRVETWSVTFGNRPYLVVDDIEDFLDQHSGSDYFYWPDQNDPADAAKFIKVVCTGWKRVSSAPFHDTLTLTLKQVFDI